MKSIVKILLPLLLFILQGCGNSSEPPALIEKKEVVQKPKNDVLQIEKNTTVTHIRVLKLDEKSKIPEHLIKIPIYQNQK